MSEVPSERFDEEIQTKRWRLFFTKGTATDYTLTDKKTGNNWQFDSVWVGGSLGRGDVVQLKKDGRNIGSVYQHQMPQLLIEAFEHLEEKGKLPEPDYNDP